MSDALDELMKRLGLSANDPMWADHAEISKHTLRQALVAITALKARVLELEAELADDAKDKQIAVLTAERDDWAAACMQARDGCNQRSGVIRALRSRLEAAETELVRVRFKAEHKGGSNGPLDA